jgi:hypothetical protein
MAGRCFGLAKPWRRIPLDDVEFETGITTVRNETAIGPISEPIDFLPFEKLKSPAG